MKRLGWLMTIGVLLGAWKGAFADAGMTESKGAGMGGAGDCFVGASAPPRNDRSAKADVMTGASAPPRNDRSAKADVMTGDGAPPCNDSNLTGSVLSADPTRLRLGMMKGVPKKWDLAANFEVFLDRLDEACADHAELFVTPECWLDGYAAADKASTPERLRMVAQDLGDSAYLKRVAEEARKRRVFICFGFTSLEHGKIYNASGLWDNAGQLIGVYHKTHLQTHDLQFTPGDALPCWPTPWGPIGIMICADRRWPETARVLRLEGARLILNPSYGMCHEANECWMRTRGYENQCFIAFVHPKVSFLVNPSGNITAKNAENAPDVLVVDVDLTQAKDDNHLQDRRPELYGIITAPKTGEKAGGS